MKKPFPIIVLILLIFGVFCLWATQNPTHQAQTDLSTGDAAIGGNFNLTDQSGRAVSDADFRGKWMLVSFGYTHCPDICPMTVATLSKTMEKLGEQGNQVAALFISVDPDRDTPAAMKDFLSNFDHRLLGLTGTREQLKEVAFGYKAYFAKQNVPWSDEEEEGEDQDDDDGDHDHHHHHHDHENYVVDHSSFIYLMDKNGKYLTHFEYNAKPEDIANAIKAKL